MASIRGQATGDLGVRGDQTAPGCCAGEAGMRLRDLTGKTFGKLTVLRRGGSNKFGNVIWFCSCSCGETHTVSGGNLLNGGTTSCGCGTYRKRSLDESAKLTLLRWYKTSAKNRKIAWSLSDEDFYSITKKDCVYCGSGPIREVRVRSKGLYTCNGVDRVDNNIGYNIFNCVPCCSICNYAKRSMSMKDFTTWIDRLIAHKNPLSAHSLKAVGSPNPSSTHSEV